MTSNVGDTILWFIISIEQDNQNQARQLESVTLNIIFKANSDRVPGLKYVSKFQLGGKVLICVSL